GLTAHPDKQWVVQQARTAAMVFGEQPVPPQYLLRDHDTKFVQEFDEVFASEGVRVVPISVQAPNMSAHAERWVQSVKQEALDHFIVFGEEHPRHILDRYLIYYHSQRPHQSLGNRPPDGGPPDESDSPVSVDEVCCEEDLGGLLKHYYRPA